MKDQDLVLETGTLLSDGRYRIVDHLGGGAEGEVYKADDLLLGERIALKMMAVTQCNDPEWNQRLFEEVKIARRINHENVCRVHDAGVAGGRPFVTMALYDRTLEGMLKQVGRYPPEVALVRSLELASGLTAIHSEGILHRDLKPANVMLDGIGRVRISDFGLARAVEGIQMVHELAGTPCYMAPELFSGTTASIRSDLYALGVLLYQVFSGHLPFDIPNQWMSQEEWFRLHSSYEREPPSHLVQNIDPEVEKLILSCLASVPEQRPASAWAMAVVLREVAPPASSTSSWRSESRTWTLTSHDGLLDTWLRSVAADHETLLPFIEHGGDVLLEHVYVELQIEPQNLGRTAVADEELGVFAGLALSLRQILEFDSKVYPWVTRRWLLRGDPGAGKTTLLRHFAARLARDGGLPWVPLFESLPRWLRERGDLFSRADSRFERGGRTRESVGELLKELAAEGRLLILLDGLDEVPRELRLEANRVLRDLSGEWPQTPIIVTSRPIGVDRPHPDFVELESKPFDRGRQRAFLARWFGRARSYLDWRKADDLLAVLSADDRLADLSGNPLYLTLIALLFESGKHPERNRARLYDQVFDMLYEGRHRPVPKGLPNRNAAHRGLCYLAFSMTLDDREAEPLRNLESRLLEDGAKEIRTDLSRVETWCQPRVFLEDVAEQTGILGPHDGSHLDWRFWHRTFREALVAEDLERRIRGARSTKIESLLGRLHLYQSFVGERAVMSQAKSIGGDEGRWAEPYALLAGRIDHPDDLVLALAKENQILGLRAAATAQGLKVDTLREILDLSDSSWMDRCRVYEKIPKLLVDPERSLSLIDQLRRNTRSGNDLFWLELTVARIAARWPRAERLARQVSERFFDHVPGPERDFIDSLEMREIAGGDLLMEFPSGDQPSLRTWGPVGFLEPFQMAAMPVTNEQYAVFDPGHVDRRAHDPVALSKLPVVGVSWYAAVSFCRWLGRVFSQAEGIRLPSEAEWEYACRAGTQSRFWSGDNVSSLAEMAWYSVNSGGRIHRSGKMPANAWGLHDMHGNVFEWTLSPGTSKDAAVDERAEAATASSIDIFEFTSTSTIPRIVRGGSFRSDSEQLFSSSRALRSPGTEVGDQGFRLVMPMRIRGSD